MLPIATLHCTCLLKAICSDLNSLKAADTNAEFYTADSTSLFKFLHQNNLS